VDQVGLELLEGPSDARVAGGEHYLRVRGERHARHAVDRDVVVVGRALAVARGDDQHLVADLQELVYGAAQPRYDAVERRHEGLREDRDPHYAPVTPATSGRG
jgi:hypothetical protein